MIPLAKDSTSPEDLKALSEWLLTNPKLTKGELTREFESQWSRWLGVPNSIFVNSGSSANLLMFYSLILSNRLRNKKVIAPAVSWATTVAPILQLGLEPVLCDCNLQNLGLDLAHFENLLKEHHPAAVIVVHVLGHPNDMDEIVRLCREHDAILLEDCCEAVGTEYQNQKLGTFGAMSSFSFYFGHQMSTIEGGMLSIKDDAFVDFALSIRSHGWARDISPATREQWEKDFHIDEFRSLYTFYFPGFNFRPTDLQAFLGLRQIHKLERLIEARQAHFEKYAKILADLDLWQQKSEATRLSSFAYGLAHKDKNSIVRQLMENEIECRPLICGSIARQPFWLRKFGPSDSFPQADFIHDCGFYVPNHAELREAEIDKICAVVRKSVGQRVGIKRA